MLSLCTEAHNDLPALQFRDVPQWELMAENEFLIDDPWLAWGGSVAITVGSVALLMACVLWVYGSGFFDFFSLTAEHPHVVLGVACIKTLGFTCTFAAILLPLFYTGIGLCSDCLSILRKLFTGASYFECGRTIRAISIVQLADSPAIECCTAVLACLFFGYWGWYPPPYYPPLYHPPMYHHTRPQDGTTLAKADISPMPMQVEATQLGTVDFSDSHVVGDCPVDGHADSLLHGLHSLHVECTCAHIHVIL